MIDVRTNSGLRNALLELSDARRWNTPLGRQVIAAVGSRARVVAARCSGAADTPRPDMAQTLVGYAWEVLVTQREQVIGARSSWAYVTTAMTRFASAEVRATDLLTSGAKARGAIDAAAHTATRVGDKPMADSGSEVLLGTTHMPPVDDWDLGLTALHDQLVRAGANAAAAREAISSGLDILNTTTRRTHLHTHAYRCQRLLGMLGRTGTCALMNLLIGSRREGPAGSAWLALRDAARAGLPVALEARHPQSVSRVHTVARSLADGTVNRDVVSAPA